MLQWGPDLDLYSEYRLSTSFTSEITINSQKIIIVSTGNGKTESK